jgi:hypothetical protein
MPGGNPRHLDLGTPGGARTDHTDRTARQAGNHRLGRRHRVHVNAMLAWAEEHNIRWHFIAPDKPMQNASARVSTAACGMSFSTRARSSAAIMSGQRSRTGPATTTAESALGAGLSYPGSLCRKSHRNERSAAQPGPATPIARCSTRAGRRKKPPRL